MKLRNVILIDYLSPQNEVEVRAKNKMTNMFAKIFAPNSRNELIECLNEIEITNQIKTLAFIGHGERNDAGISTGYTNGAEEASTITWIDLANIFRGKNENDRLILNFMAVCNTYPLRDIFQENRFCNILYGSNQTVGDTANAYYVFEHESYDDYLDSLLEDDRGMFFRAP